MLGCLSPLAGSDLGLSVVLFPSGAFAGTVPPVVVAPVPVPAVLELYSFCTF